ncbi:MAG: M20 family metallo-hydrolase [Bacteroidota bacterium]|nr:M20 family metallo-hydrolase [Bacteroidota bacterium]
MKQINQLQKEAISLLKQLIATQSFSKEEDKTADIIQLYLIDRGVTPIRTMNNIWAKNKHFSKDKPTILLNSHHDTVKPNSGYTLNPFQPIEKDGKLYGLGSNDAGGALVCLINTFLYFYEMPDLKYNIILAATAEEEISGRNGVELIYKEFLPLDFAIVGEPTNMQLAIAEKGLIVIDCIAHGVSGHAAREVGDNAIYKAIKDIEWVKNYSFPKISEVLGPVKMSVTIINSGTQQHNVIPDTCTFTIDIRVTDVYKNDEIVEIIKSNLASEVVPRSIRLKPSSISKDHPIVKSGIEMGKNTFASPTTSDQSLMDCPSLKMGPGDSNRSHSADEFIYINEIENGVSDYITILEKIVK